jgi:type 1 glutamine amidotransferase
VAITIADDGTVNRLPAGEGERTSHGKRVDALVTRVGEHPIEKGLPRQWRAADIEIYRYARGPAENLSVLSYANDPATELNFPIEWVVHYGQGRVYNATFGHLWRDQVIPTGLQCAGFQAVFVRALQWLAHSMVDTSLPQDFPGVGAPSLRTDGPEILRENEMAE